MSSSAWPVLSSLSPVILPVSVRLVFVVMFRLLSVWVLRNSMSLFKTIVSVPVGLWLIRLSIELFVDRMVSVPVVPMDWLSPR